MAIISRDQNDKHTTSSQTDDGLGSTLHTTSESGLSRNAKIAIAVTISVCVLMALFAGLIFVMERKRRAAKRLGHQSTILQRPKISSYMERKGPRQPPLLQPDPHDALQSPSTADSKYEKDFEHHELEDAGSKFESFNFNSDDDKSLPIRPPRNDSMVNSPTQSSPKQDDFVQARHQQFMEVPQSLRNQQRYSGTEIPINTNRFSTMEDTNRFSNRHSTFIDSNRQTMITVVDHDILEAVAEGRDSMQSMGVQEFTQPPNPNPYRDSNQSGYGIAITETSDHDNRHSTAWDMRRFSQRNPYAQRTRVSLHPNDDTRLSRLASSRYSKSPEGFDFNIEHVPAEEDDELDGLTPVSESSHPNVFRASQRLSRLDEPGPDPWMRRLSVQEPEPTQRVWLDPAAEILASRQQQQSRTA
ncbi:hypothetical protein AC578_5618 [Pseudocercospora eumusae]|uniref:Uncharacterized protein n=1 Tax=Pseudocercospora eumusae TaxID=321146 RepID=A0A139HSY7_9PEZI|nr:hypothetical protein AC578_5618 [Pseudocercospora eumusae]